jgi:hypothetical protein
VGPMGGAGDEHAARRHEKEAIMWNRKALSMAYVPPYSDTGSLKLKSRSTCDPLKIFLVVKESQNRYTARALPK